MDETRGQKRVKSGRKRQRKGGAPLVALQVGGILCVSVALVSVILVTVFGAGVPSFLAFVHREGPTLTPQGTSSVGFSSVDGVATSEGANPPPANPTLLPSISTAVPGAAPTQTVVGSAAAPGGADTAPVTGSGPPVEYTGMPTKLATRIVIPSLDIDAEVVLSPIVGETWQVDHLGETLVGHLQGTGNPGEPGNAVFAGHITTAHEVYGPFAGLGQIQKGDVIIVYVGDTPYYYLVDGFGLYDRTRVDLTYPTQEARVTLVTCSNWDAEEGHYKERLVVTGVLVEQ